MLSIGLLFFSSHLCVCDSWENLHHMAKVYICAQTIPKTILFDLFILAICFHPTYAQSTCTTHRTHTVLYVYDYIIMLHKSLCIKPKNQIINNRIASLGANGSNNDMWMGWLFRPNYKTKRERGIERKKHNANIKSKTKSNINNHFVEY